MVAVEVWRPAPGQPPRPVLTPDGRAVVGHPIAILARGPGSASGTIDRRYVIPLPMTFASARPLPPPGAPPGPPGTMPPPPPAAGPGSPPIAGPNGQPASESSDGQEAGTADSLYDAWSASEPPVEGDGTGNGAALQR
jgi:hypothetical protein